MVSEARVYGLYILTFIKIYDIIQATEVIIVY